MKSDKNFNQDHIKIIEIDVINSEDYIFTIRGYFMFTLQIIKHRLIYIIVKIHWLISIPIQFFTLICVISPLHTFSDTAPSHITWHLEQHGNWHDPLFGSASPQIYAISGFVRTWFPTEHVELCTIKHQESTGNCKCEVLYRMLGFISWWISHLTNSWAPLLKWDVRLGQVIGHTHEWDHMNLHSIWLLFVYIQKQLIKLTSIRQHCPFSL